MLWHVIKGFRYGQKRAWTKLLKSEVFLLETMKVQRDSRGRAPLILNLGTRCEWTTSRPDSLQPRERTGVPIAQEAGWAAGPGKTRMK